MMKNDTHEKVKQSVQMAPNLVYTSVQIFY